MKTIEAIKMYFNASAADFYAVEISLYGGKYRAAAIITADAIEANADAIKADKSSKGADVLRYRMNTNASKAIKRAAIECIPFTNEELEQYNGGNRGERFESMLIQKIGATANKRGAAFYDCGDCVKDGKQIQVKADGATLCKLSTLEKLNK